MSYALSVPCANCKKADRCVDRHLLGGAISGIHSIISAWSPNQPIKELPIGHLGGGTITLQCANIEAIS